MLERKLERVEDILKIYLNELDRDEITALKYFLYKVSVGEIAAERELELIENIKEPKKAIESLIKKRLLVRGEGCYNLSEKIRELLSRKE